MTSTYFNLKPFVGECILPNELLVAKWSHPIASEPAFLTEWGAVECARQLAFELGTYEGIVRHDAPSIRAHFPFPPHCHGHVSFCDDVDVLVGSDTNLLMTNFKIPHCELEHIAFDKSLPFISSQLESVMSKTEADPLSSLAVCISSLNSENVPLVNPGSTITCRITDQWHNPIPPDMRQDPAQTEPDPDVIPDPVHAPPFVHDLLDLAERHGAFTDLDTEDVFRVRTWYIHHVHQPRNLEFRILEFYEDWRRWETDLRGAWRDHLRLDEDVDFHVAFPDPYRGSLTHPTHADIILSQGTWVHRLPGIVTTHYTGSIAQPFTFAVAASFGPMISGLNIVVAADSMHWCNSVNHRCLITFGWNEIPCNNQQLHFMRAGHSFVLHIQNAWQILAATGDSQQGEGASSSQAAHQPHEVDQHDSHDMDFTTDANPSPGGPPPAEPPEGGNHESDSDDSIHSMDKGVLVYRLQARDEHCFVTWSTYMTILDGIVHALRLPRNQIRTFHRLTVLPPDVHEISEEAVILQSNHDVPAGSDEKLILVDTLVHFHPLASGLAVPAAASRQVLRVNQQLHRSHLLILLRLDDYCQIQQDRCIVHKNHILWDHRDRTLHSVVHGDYVRIQVPPPEDPNLDTETAIAIAQDMLETQETGCGTRRTHLSLMQTAISAFATFAHQYEFDVVINQLKTDPNGGDSPSFQDRDEHHDRRPAARTNRGFDPALTSSQLRQLRQIVDDADLVECEEEGHFAYLTTRYLHHNEQKTCRVPRAVRLSDSPEEWAAMILEAWTEVIRPDQSVSFRIVNPNPPCSVFECNQAHIIIEQGSQEDHLSFVISVVDETGDDQRIPRISHSAHSDEPLQTRSSIIHYARLQSLRQHGHCHVTWKHFPFAVADPEILEPATNVIVQIVQQESMWSSDALSLMQTSASLHRSEPLQLRQEPAANNDEVGCAIDLNRAQNEERANFQFNVNAVNFVPGQVNLFGANEFVIDLYAQWSQHTIAWDREDASCVIETWFVDHRWQHPHSRNSRQMNLYANYWQWEEEIKRLWLDHVDVRTTIEFYVVHPKPPTANNEVAAHVLLVQHEREDWVTSLVNVYEAQPTRRSLHYNVAITTHEHILVDNLLRVLGHETRCLADIPSHGFAAWYLNVQLQRGQPLAGRSGYGISIQIWQYRLVDFLPQEEAQVPQDQGPVLLQIKVDRKKICLEELLHETCDEDPESHDGNQTAVRLHVGEELSHVPSFIEVTGAPSESKVADELKHWGHDCHVFQFAGHHDFLCLPRERCVSEHLIHYIFGTIEGDNPMAAFLHSHKGERLQEHDCMKLLHCMGFLKTTVVEILQCLPDVYKVVFAHQISELDINSASVRIQTPWPDRVTESLRQLPQRFLCCDDILAECGPCRLRLGVETSDLNDFLSHEEFPLCTTFEGLQLPQSTAAVPDFEWGVTCDIATVERIVIFTDGSSISHLRHQPPELSDLQGVPDTWAFLVLGECFIDEQRKLYLIGWQAQPVHYDSESKYFLGTDRTGSDASEKEALFWAALWRQSINLDTPTVFCSDSSVSCGQATGRLSTNDYQQPFILLRSLFQSLEACLPGPRLEVRHVKGHSNDPWNDFVDYAAKAEREKSFYLPRPRTFAIQKWRSAIPYLWMVFAKNAGLPKFTCQGFDASAPELPAADTMSAHQPTGSPQEVKIEVVISFATVNVLSLSSGPEGHGGKVEYLRSQFCATCLNFLGLQETRSPQCFSTAGQVVRIASGAHRGHHGVELWVNLRQPYAYAKGQPLFFQRRHFTVRHADPRILIVFVETPFFQALVLVGHGPQSGQPLQDRIEWWHKCGELCAKHRADESQHLFVLLDANASSGRTDGCIVGKHDDHPSASTHLFREFLEEHELCLPSTFDGHVGKHTTWTSPSGDLQCRIDHVGVPQSLRMACEFSIVDETFDLGLTHVDHMNSSAFSCSGPTFASHLQAPNHVQ